MHLDNIIKNKYQLLRNYFQKHRRFIIAYSGGVDSTTLLGAAMKEDGVEVKAIHVVSELSAGDETDDARNFLKSNLVPHRLLHLNLLECEQVRDNPPDRCYHCKKEIFSAIKKIAAEESFPLVLEGSNADDLNDYRPGRIALEELEIESPLQKFEFTKEEIRRLANHLGLPDWDRPSSPCLATRIPANIPLNEADLRAVEKAEKSLRGIGLDDLRVRLHGEIARLEVPENMIAFCTTEKNRHKIIDAMKETGAHYVTLDLEGYRTGSMNITGKTEE